MFSLFIKYVSKLFLDKLLNVSIKSSRLLFLKYIPESSSTSLKASISEDTAIHPLFIASSNVIPKLSPCELSAK